MNFPASCDCPDCKGTSAYQRCGKCKCMYYCNQKCQQTHWRDHKKECNAIAVNKLEFEKKDRELDQFHKRSENSIGSECCICFESMAGISNVMQLNCEHTFCTSCMLQLSGSHSHVDVPCPLCRASSGTNVINQINRRLSLYLQRAGRCDEELHMFDLKLHYAALAQVELEKLKTLEMQPGSTLGVDFQVNLLNCGSVIARLQGRYDDSIQLAQAGLLLDFSKIRDSDMIQLEFLANIQTSYLALGEYEKAFESCKASFGIMDEGPKHTRHCRNVLANCTKASYHMGKYQQSIDFVGTVIEMNRHYVDAHKYLVLSQLALGNIHEALCAQFNAVRYETPWNPNRTAVLTTELNELIAKYPDVTINASNNTAETKDVSGSSVAEPDSNSNTA